MTAVGINAYVLLFPNPDWSDDSSKVFQAPPNISFTLDLTSSIRTLSTNTASKGEQRNGLLYVPDLLETDPCNNASKPYVSANVTRQSNLPDTDYNLIALAPWISANCTLSYLASARQDPVRAFIFYPTDHSLNEPPLAKDPMWGLKDGGQWKSNNQYPVYAIPGITGDSLMEALGHYSGNMTDIDHGHELAEAFDVRDYARLYTTISTGGRDALPSLWVFLLIVLGVLLVMIAMVSGTMHWIQRRRRRDLRDRITQGEVDLERLGIKRLTVPYGILEKMPVFVYSSEKEPPAADASSPQFSRMSEKLDSELENTINLPRRPPSSVAPRRNSDATTYPSLPSTADNSRPTSTIFHHSHQADLAPNSLESSVATSQSYAQPTCPICLEDFLAGQTEVRELPCAHIYHPGCIDEFLQKASSLCPMCKKSVLPHGSCPTKVTDMMVRRERALRRLRARGGGSNGHRGVGAEPTRPWGREALGMRMASFHRHFGRRSRRQVTVERRISSAPAALAGPDRRVEMGSLTPLPTHTARIEDIPPASRREWARLRACAMLGRRASAGPGEEETESGTRQPKWRKAVGAVFPVLR